MITQRSDLAALEQATLEYKRLLENDSNAISVSARSNERSVSPDAVFNDRQLDTAIGALGNMGISTANEFAQLAGNTLSAIPTALAEFDVNRGDFTPKDLLTYRAIQEKDKRREAGESVEYTPEEQAFMQPWTKEVPVDERNASAKYAAQLMQEQGREAVTPTKKMEPKKEILDRFFKNRERLDAFNEFFSPLESKVNQSKKETALTEVKSAYNDNVGDIITGFDKLKNDDLDGIQDMVKAAGSMTAEGLYAALSNPQATLQMTAESIPAIIAAARRMPLAIMAGSNRSFQDTLDQFEKEYKRIPIGDERAQAQAMSTLAGIVAVGSDKFLAQGARLIPKPVQNVTPRVASGTVSEAIAETTEDALVQYGGVQDVAKMSGEDLFASGIFGGVIGGGIAGGVSTADKAQQLTKAMKDKSAAKKISNTATNLGTAESVDTEQAVTNDEAVNDVASNADYTKASGLAKTLRNASKIMSNADVASETKEDAAILAKNTLATVEGRIENAKQVISDIDSWLAEDNTDVDEATIKKMKATKKETEAELTRLEKTYTNYATQVNAEFDAISSTPTKVDEIKARLTDVDEAMTQLEESSESFVASRTKRANKDAALLVDVSTSTDLVSEEDLTKAAQSPAISPQRANQLNRTAELNARLKDMAEVAKDIVIGGDGFIGLRQYQQRINNLINLGSYQDARKLLGMLNNFAVGHKQKADLVNAKFNEVKAMPYGSKLEVEGTRKQDGTPLVVHHNSGKMVDNINSEVELIAETYANLTNQVNGFLDPTTLTSNESVETETTPEPQQDTEPETKPKQSLRNQLRSRRRRQMEGSQTTESVTEDSPTVESTEEAEPVTEPTTREQAVEALNAFTQARETAIREIKNTDYEAEVRAEQPNASDADVTLQAIERRTAANNQVFEQYSNEEQARLQKAVLKSTRTNESIEAVDVISSATDAELLAVHNLDMDSRKDIMTIDAKEELERRGYKFDEQGTVVKEPIPANQVLDSVNQGGTYTGKKATGVDKSFLESNPIVTHFKRIRRGLFSKIPLGNKEKISEALGRDLRSSEEYLLSVIPKFITDFSDTLLNTLPDSTTVLKRRAFQARNGLDVFSQEDGTFNRAFASTLGLSAIEYLEGMTLQMQDNNFTAMALILKLPPKDFVPSVSQLEMLGNAGATYQSVASALGRIALKNLGLGKNANMAQNVQNNIEINLGKAMIDTLAKAGILTVNKYNAKDLASVGGNYKMIGNDHLISIYSISFNTEAISNVLGTDATDLFGATDNFIESLTSLKREPRKAQINGKPPKVSNKVNSSGGQIAAPKLVEGANKDAAVPHYINANMNQVFDVLGDDLIAQMLGEKAVIEEGEGKTKKVTNIIKGLVPKVIGKNRTVRRDINTFKQFRNRMMEEAGNLTSPFYHGYQFGKQFRLNAIGADINFQRSKLHRYLTNTGTSTINPADNTDPVYAVFKLAIAQGMGIGIDKQTLAKSLYEYEQLIAEPVVDQAVSDLVKILKGDKDVNTESILAAVNRGGEATHSLKSLVSLAELRMAGGKPFETTATLEIDGITNGVFNAHIQMGLRTELNVLTEDSVRRMAQGGLFLDGTTSYNDWISNPANWDIYQTTAADVYAEEQLLLSADVVEGVDAASMEAYPTIQKYMGSIVKIDYDTGEIEAVTSDGRKLTKNPVTVTTYAAGERSISDKIAATLMGNILVDLQTAFEAGNSTKMTEIASDIQAITGMPLPTNPVDFEFSGQALENVKTKVSQTLGMMVNSAIKSGFAAQVEATNQLTAGSNLIFTMFNVMYQERIKSKVTELHEKGELSKYEYLSDKQLQEIKDSLLEAMPVFRTFYGNAKNGVQTADYTRTGVIPDGMEGLFKIDHGLSEGITTSYTDGFTSPGAGTLALLNIASGDATTMARATQYSETDIGLNVFDARITPVANVLNASYSLNRAGYEAVVEHNITEAFAERMEKAVSMFQEQNYDLDNPLMLPLLRTVYVDYQENVFMRNGQPSYYDNTENRVVSISDKVITETITPEILSNFLKQQVLDAQHLNTLATEGKEVLKTNEIMFNQFGSTGTGVKIRNGKVVEGVKLTPDMITDAITKAETALINATKQVDVKTEGDLDTKLAEAERKVVKQYEESGALNEKASKEMLEFFKNNPEASMDSVMNELLPSMELSGFARVIVRLLESLSQSNNPPTVRVIPRGEQHKVVLRDGTVSSDELKGYYDPTTNTVWLNSGYKKNTGMTPETLLHELIHAAIDHVIHAIESGNMSSVTKAQVTAYKRIKRMMESTKGTEGIPSYAFENVNEFITWGLTNRETIRGFMSIPHKARKVINDVVNTVRELLGLAPNEANVYTELLDNAFVLARGVKAEPAINSTVVSSAQRAHDSLRQINLTQLYNRIADTNTVSISREHDIHLKETLQEAIVGVIDPVLLSTEDTHAGLTDEDALLMSRLDPSVKHNINTLDLLGFRMSAQESLVFGLYSHIIDSALNDFGWNTREIKRMYEHAKKNMTWEDFVDDQATLDTAEDRVLSQADAQARYDAVFSTTSASGYDYLRNFMALSVTNASFRERLANLETPSFARTEIRGETFRETLNNIISALLNWLNDIAITRSHEPYMADKLDRLARNIRYRKARERTRLVKSAVKSMGFVSNTLNRINNWGTQRIDAVLDGVQARHRDRTYLNAAVNLSGIVLSERRAGNLAIALDTIQNYTARGRESFVSALWSDFKGTNEDNQRIHSLLAIKNKMIDQENVHVQKNIARMVRDEFGESLTEKDSVALTKALLKTDVSSLLDHGYTLDQIQRLLTDTEALSQEQSLLASRLRQSVDPSLYNYFTNMGKALGRYMARGEATVDEMVFNTESIVTLFGTGRPDPQVSESVKKDVDVLVTLEALRMTQFHQRRRVGLLMAREAQRQNGNGVSFLLNLHKRNKQDALTKNFANNEHNYQKGYVRDIVDPYRSIQVAPLDAEEELSMQGYVRVREPLKQDKADPNTKQMYKYVSDFGGQASYLQGTLSTANKAAKGMSVIDAMGLAGDPVPVVRRPQIINSINAQKKANLDSLFTTSPKKAFNPLVPVRNNKGEVIEYRYVMSETEKDSLLRKDNRVDEVMGSMYAGVTLKVNSEDINQRLIEALHDQYEADRNANNLSRYVLIEPKSSDKVLAETWNLMPYEAQQLAKQKFGIEGVYVRNDLVNVAFGFRKWSVADLWNPNSEYPKLIKRLAVKAVEGVYGKRIANYVVRGERGLQELVKELKDIIVIKSVVVMLGNIVSNTVQLPLLHGVNPVNAIRDQITAFTAANEYRKNAKEIFDLQTRIDAGLGNAKMEQRINQLVSDQQRNPVKDLMEAGMLQTIIDDAGDQDNMYTYKHSISNRIDRATSFIPKTVKEGFKQVTIQQGSVMYDLLSETTQLSDFAARYALHKHLTKQGVTKTESLSRITDAFINYDLPPHKGMQYLNDVGLAWFFKYTIRIQKVIAKAFRENPARILAFLYGQSALDMSITNPTDSFLLSTDINNKIGLIDGVSMAANAHPIAQLY